MGAKKIIVSNVQSLAIHRLLKADKGDTPVQDLIDSIVQESHVEPWIAEKFANAWRWNHRNDSTETNLQDQPATTKQQLETYYIAAEMPKRNSHDPANGTGKVAQIILLAEQGKTTQQIIELGFNKSTVYRQVGEWKRRKAAAKKTA